jgi:hypothetical protein
MWLECNEEDVIEDLESILILCRGKECREVLDNHPRLYVEVPWSNGGPGKFMLLCGDCEFRSGTACTHTKLKINGGDGLEVGFVWPLGGAMICCTDGSSFTFGPVANRCANGCEGNGKNDV